MHNPIDITSLFALLISNWLYNTSSGIAMLAKNEHMIHLIHVKQKPFIDLDKQIEGFLSDKLNNNKKTLPL